MGLLFWTILIDVPIMKGSKLGAARSKAFKAMLWWMTVSGYLKSYHETGSSTFYKVE
jgi:hypothetical protein